MHAEQVPLRFALRLAFEGHAKAAISRLRAGLPAVAARKALDGCPRTASEYSLQVGVSAIADDESRAGHRAHKMMKLRFDRGEVAKNIGVVKLEVVQDRGARRVMHELRAL